MRGFVESLRTAVWSRTRTTEAGTAASRDRPSTTLYSCPDCEETYISEQMDLCPRCEGPVERTPSEEELGIET